MTTDPTPPPANIDITDDLEVNVRPGDWSILHFEDGVATIESDPVRKASGTEYWVHADTDGWSWTWKDDVGWVNDATGVVDPNISPPPGKARRD